MKIIDTRYIYFIVYEAKPAQSRARTNVPETGTIELELREKIQSIAHCHQISEYVKTEIQKSDQKKYNVLIINFKLLRTKLKLFGK